VRLAQISEKKVVNALIRKVERKSYYLSTKIRRSRIYYYFLSKKSGRSRIYP